ncbi:hypothetical protein ACFVIM_33690 [Streptomyces sp. NPDC057638]|uniref:hypothetical protein n=1 Tax=Streptomyces sp. NPDC057638 TaxID=3346190 RepID=UPI00368AE0C3
MTEELLTPTGAAILLAAGDDGAVSGAGAALVRLRRESLIVREYPGGPYRITQDGQEAAAEWRRRNPPEDPALPRLLPKTQHAAIQAAALRPDQRLPGYHDPNPLPRDACFRAPTLNALREEEYGDYGRLPGERSLPVAEARRPLYLTAAGREYARQRCGITVGRRRVVIIPAARSQPSAPPSLRLAAEALTAWALIMEIGDDQAADPERTARMVADNVLADADVILLGDGEYADRLSAHLPHLLAPLAGSPEGGADLCEQVQGDPGLREEWWREAAARHHPA